MKKTYLLAVLSGFLLCLGFFSTSVSAYESVVTNCPGAYYAMTGYGWITDPWRAEVRNHDYAEIRLGYGAPMFIATCSYYNPDSGDIGAQPLPPDDAYIVWVELVVSVYANHGSIIPFTLQYALGESASNVSYETATWYAGTNGTQTIIGPNPLVQGHNHYQIYWSNVTSLESWNITMLKDTIPDGYSTWVRILSNNPAGPDSIYVDYVGFEYVWTMDPAWEHGPPGSYNFSMGPMSIAGAFGTIGFIGMTVCPAYAILQWRQGGEDRVARFLMSIAAMLVFFTLFLASLGA
jgi:hypothetical protein